MTAMYFRPPTVEEKTLSALERIEVLLTRLVELSMPVEEKPEGKLAANPRPNQRRR